MSFQDISSGHLCGCKRPIWNGCSVWPMSQNGSLKRYFVGNATFIKRVVHEKRKAKNNILHISRTMDIGGAERIVYQLATDLKDEFDQVHVASTGGLWEEN